MVYTTTQLISGAYYASGIVSREFETVTGSQQSDGLIFLNEIIDQKVIDYTLIPYESSTTFNMVVGQETYTIPNLIEPNTITYLNDTVRYPIYIDNRNNYRGAPRVETITSLPYKGFWERQYGGGTLSLYFLPDQAYVATIYGVFRLGQIALGDDLSLTFDGFYITYLKYALAARICDEYAYAIPPGVQKQLSTYEVQISKQSRPLDLTMRKQSSLSGPNSINWAVVNLSKGYLP